MGSSVVREMAAADLMEAVRLLNNCYRGSHEFIEYTKESFESYLREEDARAFVVRNGALRGIATLFKSPWGNKIDLFAVKPGRRSRAIGDALVSMIEETSKVDRLYTILEEGDPSLTEWRERGYSDEGGWCHMEAQLSAELPLPPIRCQATLRTMQQADLEGLVSLTNASFGFQRLSLDCLEKWKEEEPEFDLDWVFVAESDGHLLAMLVSKPDGEYNRHFGGRRGYLGPAATLPSLRGKGLAAALTVMAMNSLRVRGMTSVNLYTSTLNAPSLGLLKKLGFKNACTYLQLSKVFKKQDG